MWRLVVLLVAGFEVRSQRAVKFQKRKSIQKPLIQCGLYVLRQEWVHHFENLKTLDTRKHTHARTRAHKHTRSFSDHARTKTHTHTHATKQHEARTVSAGKQFARCVRSETESGQFSNVRDLTGGGNSSNSYGVYESASSVGGCCGGALGGHASVWGV